MDRHSKTFEQFCHIKQRNIVMEETVYHNGKRKIICTNLAECESCGGCKNHSLIKLWTEDKDKTDKCKNVDCG